MSKKKSMNFHEARLDLICYILNNGLEYLNVIKKRNGYGKIIRNYHQSTPDGVDVYKKKRGMDYLVHSIEALEIIKKEKRFKDASKLLWYEHSVPIKIIMEKLEFLAHNKAPNITTDDVRELMDCTSLVAISLKERDKIDNPDLGLKEKMPTSEWPPKDLFARFNHRDVKIELEDNYHQKKL